MSRSRQELVLVAAMVAETSWLFAAFVVSGVLLLIGQKGGVGSPMTLPAALVVLGSSVFIWRTLHFVGTPATAARLVQTAAGVAVIYVTVASQVEPAVAGLDLSWPRHLVSTSAPAGSEFTFRAVVGSVMAIVLWWRGMALASSRDIAETVLDTFKRGVVTIGLATIVDAASSADLGLYPTVIVFIVSSLVGLSGGRLAPASSESVRRGTWPAFIGLSIAAVLAIGLLFGLVPRAWLLVLPGAVWGLWLLIVDNLVLPIVVLIARLLSAIIQWLLSLWISDNPGDVAETIDGSLMDLQQAEEDFVVSPGVEIATWIFSLVGIAVAIYLLSAVARRRQRARVDATGERQSVRGDADLLFDAAKLLFGLLPASLRRRRRASIRVPEGEPRVVEALRIYYQILFMAEARGIARPPWETPAEFQAKLEAVFPARLVRMATAAFNRACYGYLPSAEEHLSEMRLQLGSYK